VLEQAEEVFKKLGLKGSLISNFAEPPNGKRCVWLAVPALPLPHCLPILLAVHLGAEAGIGVSGAETEQQGRWSRRLGNRAGG